MDNKKTFVALIVVAIIAIGGIILPQGGKEVVVKEVKDTLGAFAGPDIMQTVTFFENYSTRGHVATTTTATAFTLTTRELNKKTSYLEWNTGVNTTLTSMASTTAPFSQLAIGEGFSVDFYSSTTTAAATITFAAGTGVDLQEDEGETVIVNGLEQARLNFRKKTNGDVLMWVELGQVGD